MKAYKGLLSILLCLAMVLGMVGAVAEANGGGVVLSNLTVNLEGETIVIGPSLSMAAEKVEDGLKLRMEAINGEKVVVPVTVNLNEQGVRFSMDDDGRVYTADVGDLLSMSGMEGMDQQTVDFINEKIEICRAFLNYKVTEENFDQYTAWIDNYCATAVGSAGEETQQDFGGKSYNVVKYAGRTNLENAVAALEFARTSEPKEFADVMTMVLDIINLIEGTEVESYTELVENALGIAAEDDPEAAAELEAIMKEESADLEFVIGGDETTAVLGAYLDLSEEGMKDTLRMEMITTAGDMDVTVFVDQADEAYGTSNVLSAAYHMDADGAELTMNNSSNTDGYYTTEIDLTCNLPIADGVVTGIDADMQYNSGYSYVEEGMVDSMSTGINVALDGSAVDGLWNMTLDTDLNNEYSYGPEGEAEVYTENVAIDGSWAQLAGENGITNTIALNAAYDGLEYGLSFDVEVAEDANIADLPAEGENVYALTENTEDLAYTMLYADVMSLAAGAMELAADEGVARLTTLITDAFINSAVEVDDYSEYDVEAEFTEVATMEEVAAIYEGNLPEFTIPEGYVPDGLYVHGWEVDTYFACGEKWFNYYVSDYGMDMGVEGPTYSDDPDSGITYVEFVNGSTYVLFIFDNMSFDRAEMENIVAGLKI